MINLTLDNYTFSSALPDDFTITQVAGDYVDVTVKLGAQSIYSTRLFENNGTATFHEFWQIVEQNMMERGLISASLEVRANDNGMVSVKNDIIVVFSKYRMTSGTCIDFLETHFLTNRTFYNIPREYDSEVLFFATENESFYPFYNCVFERNGQIFNFVLYHGMSRESFPTVYRISLNPATITGWVQDTLGENPGKLLSFTLHVGNRSLKVFVVEETPCAVFSFRNSYNSEETIFVFGTSTLKTEIIKKEAVSQDITSFYDKVVSRKWDVTTVPLSIEEATWYNEFLDSEKVSMFLSQTYPQQEILISDITSEINDSPKDLTHIKFSYRFNDNAFWRSP